MRRVKTIVKAVLSEDMRMRVRRLGRLRWFTKAGVARGADAPLGRRLRFVLTDPEVDSFTYEITNVAELADTLAEVTGLAREELHRHLLEAAEDPELRAALHQPLRRLLWAKRDPPLHGFLLTHWAIIRTTRPAHVAEAGVLDGLGSAVMLAALARNRAEGSPGALVSVDVMPNAGALVPDAFKQHWTLICGDSATALAGALEGTEVGYFVSDSLPDSTHVHAELAAVQAHRAPQLFASAVWSALTTFDDEAAAVARFQDRPRDHVYAGRSFQIARL